MTEYSESSISGTISKLDITERSMLKASMDDAESRLAEGIKPVSIASESIQKGNTLLETYEVLSEAIHGGMGSVWCVHHKSWNTDLAMKRPQPEYFAEGSRRRKEEFIRECENWIDLGLHPNIVSCYYVRDISGVPSIFSEWMDNGSLKDRIADGTLYEGTEEEVQKRILDIAIQSARGLQYSHENGLIHQDIKPGNILLTKEWDAKIADFGLAKAGAQLTEGSDTGRTSGYTPAYCPKEQAEKETPAEWMDLYAWALTVLEMYLGKRIWERGADVPEMLGNTDVNQSARIQIPADVLNLICDCVISDDGDHIYDFSDAENILLEIYEERTGERYPRPVSGAAEDSAASLNNKALSFKDLGKDELADDLWYESMSVEDYYPEAVYNQKLAEWMQGTGTDIDLLTAIEKISDKEKMGDLHLMAQKIRRERPQDTELYEYKPFVDLAKKGDSRYSSRKLADLHLKNGDSVFSAVKDRCFVFSRKVIKKTEISSIYVMDQQDFQPETFHPFSEAPNYQYENVRACRESPFMDGEGLVLYSKKGIRVVHSKMPAVMYEYSDEKHEILTVCGGKDRGSCYFSDGNSVYRTGPDYSEPELFMKAEENVWSLKLRMNGNILLISDNLTFIIAADTDTGKVICDHRTRNTYFDWYDLSEDGKCIYTGCENNLNCYDLQTDELLSSFEFPYERCKVTDMSSDYVLIKSIGYISIWDIKNYICLRSIRRERIGEGFFLHKDNWKDGMIEGMFFWDYKQSRLVKFEISARLPEPEWALVKVTETAEQIEEDEKFRNIIEQAEKAADEGNYTSARDLLEEARRIPGRKNARECQKIYDQLYPHFRRGKLTECIFQTDYSFAFKSYLPVFSDDGRFLIGRASTKRIEVRYTELLEEKAVDPVLNIKDCWTDKEFVCACGGKRLACIIASEKFALYDIPSGNKLTESDLIYRGAELTVIHENGNDFVIAHKKGMFGPKILEAVNAETAETIDDKTAKSLLKNKSEYAGTNEEGISYRMETVGLDHYLCFYDKSGKKIRDVRVDCHNKEFAVEFDNGVLQAYDMIIYSYNTKQLIASVWEFPFPKGQALPLPAPYDKAVMSANCRYLYTKGNVYKLEWELLDEQET